MANTIVTREEIQSALKVVIEIGRIIHDDGPVPESLIVMALGERGWGADVYPRIVPLLEKMGFRRQNHQWMEGTK